MVESRLEIPNNPNEQMPFEVIPEDGASWNFNPRYYPDRFPHTRAKELDRNPQQCDGEDVEVKNVKNLEIHASGLLLSDEIGSFIAMRDHDGPVVVYNAVMPDGGMQVEIKNAELNATPEGYDGFFRQRQFPYTIDFVATAHDERSGGENAIVTKLINQNNQ